MDDVTVVVAACVVDDVTVIVAAVTFDQCCRSLSLQWMAVSFLLVLPPAVAVVVSPDFRRFYYSDADDPPINRTK